jgi:hypothetical protein
VEKLTRTPLGNLLIRRRISGNCSRVDSRSGFLMVESLSKSHPEFGCGGQWCCYIGWDILESMYHYHMGPARKSQTHCAIRGKCIHSLRSTKVQRMSALIIDASYGSAESAVQRALARQHSQLHNVLDRNILAPVVSNDSSN